MKAKTLARLDILTLFPAMFDGPLTQSLLGRARDRGVLDLYIHNLRDYSEDKRHHAVDDRPYGGGAGMVLQAQPIFAALKVLKTQGRKKLGRSAKPWVVYMSPQGRVLSQAIATELSQKAWIIVLCGHYEGVDERILKEIDEEISIGDYVLTGGEIPAMVVADTVVRLVPGVVKEPGSILEDSFQGKMLDHPHYTRPEVWRGEKVPPVLLSGHHKAIKIWRSEQAQAATVKKRPDLLGG